MKFPLFSSMTKSFALVAMLMFAATMVNAQKSGPGSVILATVDTRACQNGARNTPEVACTGSAWANGNLNINNSQWVEGEFVPIRLVATGAQLARALEDQLTRGQGRVASLSGIRAEVTCDSGTPHVALSYDDGRAVPAGGSLIVAASSYAAGRTFWTAVEGEPGVESAEQPTLIRDAVTRWLWHRGPLKALDFLDPGRPRWTMPPQGPACGAAASSR